MDPEWWKRIQIVLIVFVLVALARVGYIFYERRDPGTPPAKPQLAYNITVDDYVTSHKIFPYDMKSAAKELVGKTVWVRTGNTVPYYRYSPANRNVDLAHRAGLLAPLAKLQVVDLLLQRAPVTVKPGQIVVVRRKIVAVFTKQDGPGNFGVSIGDNSGGDDFTFIANDLFFFDDPHEMYKHWPADVWTAIDQHQGKKGMNELQMSFALGNPIGASSGDFGNRWMQYGDPKNPVKVTFEKNQAVEIAQ
jgi:hypothetical protein